MSRYYRKDGYPEQAGVRKALQAYLAGFDSYKEAAEKIGINTSSLRCWRRGDEPVPQWFCEALGFRRVVTWERAAVEFIPTGKSA